MFYVALCGCLLHIVKIRRYLVGLHVIQNSRVQQRKQEG